VLLLESYYTSQNPSGGRTKFKCMPLEVEVNKIQVRPYIVPYLKLHMKLLKPQADLPDYEPTESTTPYSQVRQLDNYLTNCVLALLAKRQVFI
jgi:hypothetical protein